MLHPYIGLRATRPASTNPKLPEVSGIIVAVGTDSEECDGYAVHYPCVVLFMADGGHEIVPMYRVKVDPIEAAARLAKAHP